MSKGSPCAEGRRKLFLRRGDVVKVMSGEDKGKTGRILRVLTDRGLAVVEGVNFIWKHLRRSQDHPHGARIQKEAPIQASNLRIVCQACSKPTRVRREAVKEAARRIRVRLCKLCGQSVNPEG